MKEKKRLSSGKWLVLFLVTALLVAMVVPAFNIITDPYGAFGDPVTQWWSYDMTMNPKVAKFTYLQQNHDKYDSYIIGASGSSILSVEALNEYLDAHFFNTFFYYSNAKNFREIAAYLLDHYEVKNLVLNMSFSAAADNPESGDVLTKIQHWKVEGSNPLAFYFKYLYVNPQQGIQKLKYRSNDVYMPHGYKNMTPETGEYDRSTRDTENIRDLKNYLKRKAYAPFTDYSKHSYSIPYLEDCAEAISEIKARCEEKGVNLIVVCQPMYYMNLNYYSWDERDAFFNRLAEVTDYWDFTLTTVSYDPRFFYDTTHARNSVGKMMLARIFKDERIYCPENFGRYVAQGSVPGAPDTQAADEASYSAKVPILQYSQLVETEPENTDQISVAAFSGQMQALAEAGYTPVDIWQMRDYVEHGGTLPEKPVLITFDGGFLDNYTLAYPILKEHGFRATIFVSGVRIGKDTYKDTGVPIVPHFSLEQAREMTDSGLITIASNGFDVQEIEGVDPDPIRPAALQREGESEADYVDFLTKDALQMRELLGDSAGFFSYPNRQSDPFCLLVLVRAGTFATVAGTASYTTLIRGLPQSLLNMPRKHVDSSLSGADLVKAIDPG